MKKLNKLQINSEKIIKNEELVALKGGYDPWVGVCCECYFPFDPTRQTAYFDVDTFGDCWNVCQPGSPNFVC
jgi:natural product precursor